MVLSISFSNVSLVVAVSKSTNSCRFYSTGPHRSDKIMSLLKLRTNGGMKFMQATVVICSAKLARKLLKAGYSIVDIKPDKGDLEGKRSVFVFRNDDGLIEKMVEYQKATV